MNAQPATQGTIQTTPSKCTSGPDCPCEFCVTRQTCRRPIGERHRKATRRRLPPLVFAQASLSRIGTHRHHFQSNFVAARARRRKLKTTRIMHYLYGNQFRAAPGVLERFDSVFAYRSNSGLTLAFCIFHRLRFVPQCTRERSP